MNSKKTGGLFPKIFGGIFFIVGVIILVAGICLYINTTNKIKNGDKVVARISDVSTYRDSDGDRHSTYYADYTYNGEEYQHVHLSYSSSSYYIGKEIRIYVNPDNPTDVVVSGSAKIILFLMVPMGLIFAAVGGSIFSINIINACKAKKLRANGRRIPCEVVRIAMSSVQMNGVTGRIIICRDSYTGNEYSSTRIYQPIETWIQPGSTIYVYVDPNNPNRYFVEEPTEVNQYTY